MKDIEIVSIDYSGVNQEFKRTEQIKIAEIPQPWIVPGEGPFYEHSVRLYNGGLPLTPNDDYTFAEPVPSLTEKTGKPVSLYIELKDHILINVERLELEYQKVGTPTISRNALLKALEDMIITGDPIDFENQITGKPLTYKPSAHSMDMSKEDEMVGFGGMIFLFNALASRIKISGSHVIELMEKLEKTHNDRLTYIQNLRWSAVMNHIRNYKNPHDLKKGDVNLDKLENFATASDQQDSEGLREDLYSTPLGLKRVLDETEPDSEEFIFQNELPFSYYGSGIYIPPPITGSFEGLGGDYENSCFVREGNGWIVGLIHQFDGRVKRLNYVYQELMLDINNVSQFIPTYLPYEHPDLTAAGAKVEAVANGSGKDLLAISDINHRTVMYMTLTNGTLDPGNHSYYEIDTTAFWAGMNPSSGLSLPATTIAKIGSWVYLFTSTNTSTGIVGEHPNANEAENFQMRIYRFPLARLSDVVKTKIVPTLVNINYDNVDRVRKNNQPFFQLYDMTLNGPILKALFDFTKPIVNFFSSHRKRQVIVLENPDVKGIARVKFIAPAYWVFQEGTEQGSHWVTHVINYEFDTNTNTLTIHPEYVKPIVNPQNAGVTNYNERQATMFLDMSLADRTNWPGGIRLFTDQFAWVNASWIPGIGIAGFHSYTVGGAPYVISYAQLNESGDPANDYNSLWGPTWWKNARGQRNLWSQVLVTPSPFGVAGFPRMYSDIYEYNGKVNAVPIEQFLGEREDQGRGYFNRLPEPGNGLKYIQYPQFQTPYIQNKIFGRQPNASFGKTLGLTRKDGLRNWPTRRDALSTTHCVADMHFRDKRGTWDSSEDISGKLLDRATGLLRLPICYNWTYDPITRALVPTQDLNRTVYMTEADYKGRIKTLIGPELSRVNELMIHVDLDPEGTGNRSTVGAWYNTSDKPTMLKAVGFSFNWTKGTGNKIQLSNVVNRIRMGQGSPVSIPPSEGGNADFYGNSLRTDADGYLMVGISNSNDSLTLLKPKSDAYTYQNGITVTFSQSNFIVSTTGNMITMWTLNDPNIGPEPIISVNSVNVFTSYNQAYAAIDGMGIMVGISPVASGGAMSLVGTGDMRYIDPRSGFTGGEMVLQGATFVEGNWSFFVNADITVTFNGYSMSAYKRAFDLRDFTNEYRSRKFYLYVVARGSAAEYELDEFLRFPSGEMLLVATITTDEFGVSAMERFQPFAISGYPLTRDRDAGIPVSSGSLVEDGTYRFIKRSELYSG